MASQSWTLLTRRRHLQAFEQLLRGGLSVLGLMPQAAERYLDAVPAVPPEHCEELQAYLLVRESFWQGLPWWWRELASYQSLMANTAVGGCGRARRLHGEDLVHLDPALQLVTFAVAVPTALELVPQHALTTAEQALVRAKLTAHFADRSRQTAAYLFVSRCRGRSERVVELTDGAGLYLKGLKKRPKPWATVAAQLDAETRELLLHLRVFIRV